MKAFLAEQIRATYERCGQSSLLDLPRLISSRLPDFFNQIIRQLVNTTSGQFSTPVLNAGEVNTGEREAHLRQLPCAVFEEYKRVSGKWTACGMVTVYSLFICSSTASPHTLFQMESLHGHSWLVAGACFSGTCSAWILNFIPPLSVIIPLGFLSSFAKSVGYHLVPKFSTVNWTV